MALVPLTDALVCDANLRASMGVYGAATEAGDSKAMHGMVLTSSGVNCAVFNSAMLTEPIHDPSELQRKLLLAGMYFAKREVGWSFWMCEDLIGESLRGRLSGVLDRLHLRCVSMSPGMACAELRPAERPLPPLEYRAVRDEASRMAFCQVMSVVFALPFMTAQRIYGGEAIWEGPMQGWVGEIEGKPAVMAATVTSEDCVGVYSVGTAPAYRRHGYGEAIVRHALRETIGEQMPGRIILQSTKLGLRLYMRMGFQQVTQFRVYLYEGRGFSG